MNTKKIEELEQTIKQAQAQIEELKREDETPKFKYPKKSDIVWYISPDGEVNHWCWTDKDYERASIHQGNIFSTQEQAEFERERRKVITELKLFAEPEDREWDGNNEHYFIAFDFSENIVTCHSHIIVKRNDIYFETEEDCQKAIDFVGADRVKKYYLRVKD